MKGFTLTDLLITIAIAAILVAFAIPSYQKFLINNRSLATGTSLVAALRLARSEAITRGKNVAVCALNNTQSACGDNTDWQYGFRVWDPSGEVIRDFPMNLAGYISYCCNANVQYTATGTPTALTCSCSDSNSSSSSNKSPSRFSIKIMNFSFITISTIAPPSPASTTSYGTYFQIKPKNCSNVYTISIDPIGRPQLNTGAACQ